MDDKPDACLLCQSCFKPNAGKSLQWPHGTLVSFFFFLSNLFYGLLCVSTYHTLYAYIMYVLRADANKNIEHVAIKSIQVTKLRTQTPRASKTLPVFLRAVYYKRLLPLTYSLTTSSEKFSLPRKISSIERT